uniref:uncharacterized protein n=1 Tax=Myxine glutinosa TaxID=7769 RepID=UPI00358F9524
MAQHEKHGLGWMKHERWGKACVKERRKMVEREAESCSWYGGLGMVQHGLSARSVALAPGTYKWRHDQVLAVVVEMVQQEVMRSREKGADVEGCRWESAVDPGSGSCYFVVVVSVLPAWGWGTYESKCSCCMWRNMCHCWPTLTDHIKVEGQKRDDAEEDPEIVAQSLLTTATAVSTIPNLQQRDVNSIAQGMTNITGNLLSSWTNDESGQLNANQMNKTFSQVEATFEIVGSTMTERMVPGGAANIFNSSIHTFLVKVASGSSPGDLEWETADVKASVPNNTNNNNNNDPAMSSPSTTPLTVMTYKKSPFTWDNSSAFMDSAVVQLQVGSAVSMAHSKVTLTLDSRPIRIRGPQARVVRSTAQSTCTRCWLVLKFLVPSRDTSVALDILNTSWFEKPITVYFLNGEFSGSKPVFQQNFTVFPLNLTEHTLTSSATPIDASGVESTEAPDTSGVESTETPDNMSVTAKQEPQNEHFLPGPYERLFVKKTLVKAGLSYFFIEHADNKSSIHTIIRMFQCYTRNPYTGQWSSNNIQTQPSQSTDTTSCLLDKDTFPDNIESPRITISASLFLPNTIDFNTVWAKFDLTNNAAVFGTVITIVCTYILLGLWVRRADVRDHKKWKILPLKDNLVEHEYMYLISFTTGLIQHAGTESNAFFHLQFEKGNTGARKLDNGYYKGFDRADTRMFVFSIPSYLGKPTKIRIWHDDSGIGHKGSWFVDEIRLFDIQLDELSIFEIRSWLAVEYGDQSISRTVPVSNVEKTERLQRLLPNNIKEGLSNSHLWMSIFMRVSTSRFTRLERLSVCVCLLFLMMITNAMFFGLQSRIDTGISETGVAQYFSARFRTGHSTSPGSSSPSVFCHRDFLPFSTAWNGVLSKQRDGSFAFSCHLASTSF